MEQEYIGIDLHKAFFQVCTIDGTGERQWEQRWPTNEAGIAGFLTRCGAQRRVAVEAPSPPWAFVDRIVPHVGDSRGWTSATAEIGRLSSFIWTPPCSPVRTAYLDHTGIVDWGASVRWEGPHPLVWSEEGGHSSYPDSRHIDPRGSYGIPHGPGAS